MVTQLRLGRGSCEVLFLAVNSRPISARGLVYALEECYQGRLERGRHPLAAIAIGIDPALVDVNVHPAKREVRFREEGAVFAALQRAVRSALGASEPIRYETPQAVSGVFPARAMTPQLPVHGALRLVA